MAYAVEIKNSAQRELVSLQVKDRRLVEARIQALSINPRISGAIPLKGEFHGLYRYKAGNFRIIYQINDDRLVIVIVKIGDRKDVYG